MVRVEEAAVSALAAWVEKIAASVLMTRVEEAAVSTLAAWVGKIAAWVEEAVASVQVVRDGEEAASLRLAA